MTISTDKIRPAFWLFAGFFILSLVAAILQEQYFWIIIPFGILTLYLGWQNINIAFFFLLATLPFSAEYHFNQQLGTDIPDEFLMLSVAALFILYFAFKPAVLQKPIFKHPLIVLLFFSVIWILITALFSTDILVSVKFFLAKCWYIGAFVMAALIVFQQKQKIKTAMIILASAMFVVTIIILIRHAGYGFDFANINNAVFPFFRNHVNYSAMLVCIIPVFFAFHKAANSIKGKWLIRGCVAVLMIALFFSYARGAWLAFIAGLVAYWLIRKRILVAAFIVAIIISVAFLFWAKKNDHYLKFTDDFKTTIFHKDFRQHLIATYRLKDISTAERFYRWVAGVRMIKDNWLTGYGPNTFYDNYKPYAIPAFKTWVSDNKEHSTVHNYFLLTTIEQGIPGLIFFLLLLGTMLYYTQHLYHRIKDNFYKIVVMTTGVVLTMLIIVNFLSDLIETDKAGSIFFLCLSLLIIADVNTKEESDLSSHIQSVS